MRSEKSSKNFIIRLCSEAPLFLLIILLSIGASLVGLLKMYLGQSNASLSLENPPVSALFSAEDDLALGDPEALPMTGNETDYFHFDNISMQTSAPLLQDDETKGVNKEAARFAAEAIYSSVTEVAPAPETAASSEEPANADTTDENAETQEVMLCQADVQREPLRNTEDAILALAKDPAPVTMVNGEMVAIPEPTEKAPGVQEYIPVPVFTPRCGSYDYTGVKPLTTTYDYDIATDDSYFDDALFIGDSRVEGLYLYGNLRNATFAYKRGCSISYIPTGELNYTATDTTTLARILSSKAFGKVYIMVGVNELSGGSPAYYGTHYKTLVDMILSYQPDTTVFMFGTMYVTKAVSDANTALNNDNIDSRSCRVAALANGINIFYLDMNPSVADETGYVNPNYSWDGIHLKPEYYANWVQFMREHVVTK